MYRHQFPHWLQVDMDHPLMRVRYVYPTEATDYQAILG